MSWGDKIEFIVDSSSNVYPIIRAQPLPTTGIFTFPANISLPINGLMYESAADTITAFAAGGQSSATQITNEVNRVTVAANPGSSVKLPLALAGLTIYLVNAAPNSIQVFGTGTDTIDSIAAATGVSQMVNSVVIFTCTVTGKWFTDGLATGYAGNGLQTLQFADGISAAGTSQPTGTQLTAAINNVTTVGTGAGVNLPASSPGLTITVQNNGANPLLVYPFQGATDTINGVAATQGVLILPGSIANFNCTTAGAWTVQPASTKDAVFNTNTSTTSATLTAGNVSGGVASVDLQMTGTLGAGANAQLPTVSALVAVLHAPTVGTSYRLRITNASAGAFAWTVTTNTGWGTLNGTMTINQNTWREFVVTLTTLTTATLQSVATGTYS